VYCFFSKLYSIEINVCHNQTNEVSSHVHDINKSCILNKNISSTCIQKIIRIKKVRTSLLLKTFQISYYVDLTNFVRNIITKGIEIGIRKIYRFRTYSTDDNTAS